MSDSLPAERSQLICHPLRLSAAQQFCMLAADVAVYKLSDLTAAWRCKVARLHGFRQYADRFETNAIDLVQSPRCTGGLERHDENMDTQARLRRGRRCPNFGRRK